MDATYETMNHTDVARAATERAAERDLEASPTVQWAIREIAKLDIKDRRKPPPPGKEYGFGRSMVGVQDTGGDMLEKQLLSSEIRSVPEHMEKAQECAHPASLGAGGEIGDSPSKRECARDLRAAIEYSIRQEGMEEEFGERAETLRDIAERLQPVSATVRARYSPQHIVCAATEPANVAFYYAATKALDLQDKDIATRMLLGAKVAGDLPATKAWDPKFKPRSLGLDFEDLPHAQWNTWLARDVERQATSTETGRRDAEAVRVQTVSEVDQGLADGFFDKETIDAWYGSNWRALRRFAVMQGVPPKARVCDNGKGNLLNAGTSIRDKLWLPRADFPARMATEYTRAHEGAKENIRAKARDWSLIHGSEDVGSAYRKMPVDTQRWTVVAMYNRYATPREGEAANEEGYSPRVQYILMPGCPFGLVASVTAWCAVGTFAAHCARRLLAVTCEAYVDDFDITGLERWGNAPQRALRVFMKAIGMPFSEVKSVDMAPQNVFCGVVTDFTRMRKEGIVMVYVSNRRRKKLVRELDQAKSGLTPETARRLVGKLGFTLAWTFGRVGRAAMQPLQARADSESDDAYLTWPILRSINFLKEVVRHLPRREIVLTEDDRMPIIVWSDARYERDAVEPAQGGFVVFVPGDEGESDRWIASAHVTPRQVVDYWEQRKQYIGQLELYYAVAPYWTLPEIFAGRQVIHFIDNTSACAALIKLYSRALDSGLVVNAFHAFNAGLKADVFFEYVRSEANVGDYPSRDAWEELWAAFEAIGVDSYTVEWVECALPPITTLQEAAGSWMRVAEERAEGDEGDWSGYGRPDREREESGAEAEAPDSAGYYRKLWVRDARFHEYDEFVGSPHDEVPRGVQAETVEHRARRYGRPQPRRDGSFTERLRVVREHMRTILTTPNAVHRIRSELRGRRLAGTSGGWPSTVDNLAQVANCSVRQLWNLRERHGL